MGPASVLDVAPVKQRDLHYPSLAASLNNLALLRRYPCNLARLLRRRRRRSPTDAAALHPPRADDPGAHLSPPCRGAVGILISHLQRMSAGIRADEGVVLSRIRVVKAGSQPVTANLASGLQIKEGVGHTRVLQAAVEFTRGDHRQPSR